MSLRAVITTDLHLRTTDKYGKILPNGRSSRLQDCLDHLAKSVTYAIEHKATHWICLGDVFDKINPAESLRNAFVEVLAPLVQHKIPIIVLIGNHDTDAKVYSLMTESSIFNMLDSNAITVLSEPCEMQLEGVDTVMIPWTTDEVVAEWLTKTKDKIVFGHWGVDGALVSGTEFVLSLGVNQKLFDHHRYTYLGHYHKPQATKKWMYIGSLHKVDFGERNDKKGFLWLKASNEKIEHKFIDVNDRPFFQHTINESEDPDFAQLYKWESLDGYVVKLIFVGEEDWYLRFNMGEIRSRILKSLEAHKLFFEHRSLNESRIRVPEIDTSSSWQDGIDVYCKKQKRPDMVDLGTEILKEVL
jgi:DNA repair protein SbcD/Mre11